MKKQWIRPLTKIELFAPNEYCSSCGETITYKFKCDAPGGDLYIESNGKEGLQRSGSYDDGKYVPADSKLNRWFSSYGPCGETHDANVKDDFFPGYVYNAGGLGRPSKTTNVIVWRGEDGDNGHATTNLNQSSWGKNMS